MRHSTGSWLSVRVAASMNKACFFVWALRLPTMATTVRSGWALPLRTRKGLMSMPLGTTVSSSAGTSLRSGSALASELATSRVQWSTRYCPKARPSSRRGYGVPGPTSSRTCHTWGIPSRREARPPSTIVSELL